MRRVLGALCLGGAAVGMMVLFAGALGWEMVAASVGALLFAIVFLSAIMIGTHLLIDDE